MADQKRFLNTLKPDNPTHWGIYVGLVGTLVTWAISLQMNWAYAAHIAIVGFGIGFLTGMIYAIGYWKGTRVGKNSISTEWKELKFVIEDAADLGRLFNISFSFLTDSGKMDPTARYINDFFWQYAVNPAIKEMSDDNLLSVQEAATVLHQYCTYIHEFYKKNEGILITKDFEDLYNRRITNRIEPIASTKRYTNPEGGMLWYPRGSIHITRLV